MVTGLPIQLAMITQHINKIKQPRVPSGRSAELSCPRNEEVERLRGIVLQS